FSMIFDPGLRNRRAHPVARRADSTFRFRGSARALVAALASAALVALAQASQAGDLATTVLLDSPWPMYGHDVKHTFRSPLVASTDGHLLAPTPLPDVTKNEAVATDDGKFIMGSGFSTVAVRADGAPLWQTRV